VCSQKNIGRWLKICTSYLFDSQIGQISTTFFQPYKYDIWYFLDGVKSTIYLWGHLSIMLLDSFSLLYFKWICAHNHITTLLVKHSPNAITCFFDSSRRSESHHNSISQAFTKCYNMLFYNSLCSKSHSNSISQAFTKCNKLSDCLFKSWNRITLVWTVNWIFGWG